MTEVRSFDVCGPLPTGATVLEASAGTGKTFAIAALAARFVADGMRLDQMLLVTFTRMATGELRERVRDRILTAERGLALALEGAEADPTDEVLVLLANGTPEEVEIRRARLAAALSGFDAATITTTHGFCHQMLAGLGVTGDIEPDADVVEHVDDLVAEVVEDRYLARTIGGSAPSFDLGAAREVAEVALRNPRTPIVAVDGPADAPARLRGRLALTVRTEVERRKRNAGVITYDDLLTRLSDALRHEVSGPANRQRLRERYRVVLVDEFQDTDALQWRILSDAFLHEDCTLVLIGDPKQAIYAFRGADVHAYLDAAVAATDVATLGTNWRSDLDLIRAFDAVFDGAALGHHQIVYRPVEAAPQHHARGLADAPITHPLRLRVVDRGHPEVSLTPTGAVGLPSARAVIARDLANDVVDLLSSGAVLVDRTGGGPGERVRPRHLAVLTRTNKEAALIRNALDEAGVPAVIHGAGSVFATPAATKWLRLLEALERPGSATRVRAASLTAFVGFDAAELDDVGEAELEQLHATIHTWADLLRRSGVASLLELITRATAMAERVLAFEGGERLLTDLRHVAQLLHEQATTNRLGTTAMTAWVRERIDEAAAETGAEERSQRLESDAEAVQVLTVHSCKGLEFPIVYYPFLWRPSYLPDEPEAIIYHDTDGTRTLDVAGGGNDFSRHLLWHRQEARGEDLRLLYVALTRARHQAVVWWCPSWDSKESALGRLLFERAADGSVPAFGPKGPRSDDEVDDRFLGLAGTSDGRIGVERVRTREQTRWSAEPSEAAPLAAAEFDRGIDLAWRRASYSSLTSAAYEATVASEPELHDPAEDEAVADQAPLLPASDTPEPSVEEPLRSTPLTLGEMPGGAQVGTVLHSVLESVDFAADDLDAAVTGALASVLAHRPVSLGDLGTVRVGLTDAIRTPLGPLLADRTLADVGAVDRLDEMVFELPIAGGDRPVGDVQIVAIADLVEQHTADDDPLHGYADRLRDPVLASTFHGFLTGSIDLVVRSRRPDGEPAFAVVDYKSNHLSGDEPPSAWHYRPAALADAMQHAHYPLQALLYQVALHRYLRWRLAGYDPDRHLAGILYLFLRGMTGPEVPRVDGHPCGVFAWRPPTELVTGLSELLDRGVTR